VYYTRHSNRHKGHLKHRFPKLSALCDTKSHLVLSAIVDRGPKLDYAEFKPAVDQALSRHRFETLLADAGYESEAAHVYCREELDVTSIIPTTRRGRKRIDGKPRNLTGRYRKLLHKRFPKKTYGQRWQIETVFSMIKRNLGSALTSRRPYSINREVILRVITHNLMIIRRLLLSFQQSNTVPIILYYPGLEARRTGGKARMGRAPYRGARGAEVPLWRGRASRSLRGEARRRGRRAEGHRQE